jgi:nitrile hydratase beta subunit
VAEFGFMGRQSEKLVVVENTPEVHNVVVCTLCSCYPWAVLGLPPVWYKSPPYRARAVIDPRGVLKELGVSVPESREVRVWDSTAEIRYMVLPERPKGTEKLSEEELAALITRDADDRRRRGEAVNGAHDLGGMHGFGPVDIERDEPVFHSEWERRAFAITLASGFLGKWNIDMSRFAREQMPPAEYLATSYYEHWAFGLEKLLHDHGLVTKDELEARLRDAAVPAKPVHGARVLAARDVEKALRTSRTSKADEDVAPRYKVGDRVITKNVTRSAHAPAALRAGQARRGRAGPRRVGVPRHRGQRPRPQAAALLHRALHARELWGDDAPARDAVHIDLWDDHLEPA